MALFKTSHYEFSSDPLNIIIYGVNIQELYPEFSQTLPNMDDVQQKIPDIMEKLEKTTFSKKGIMLYVKEKENLHRRSVKYFI